MLRKLYEVLYHKIFINIVVERSQSIVYIEECSKDGMISSDFRSFDTTTLNIKMYNYINNAISQSPFHYISILDTSPTQGAIPTCTPKKMSTFCDVASLKYICYKDRWAYYTSKHELSSLQYSYSKIGTDFVFSPFVILANFFKDKINTTLALFVLIEDKYITVGIFDNSELLYANHLDIEYNSDSDELIIDENSIEGIELDLDESIDLEDIDVIDEMEGLDDFGDIEDLDSIDELDEFNESQDEELEVEDKVDGVSIDNISGFSEDYHRFLLIQNSINQFYKDLKYDSKFIETVYIADTIGVSEDLKRYLEEEMFLSVFVRKLDLTVEICEIAKAELK